MKTVEDQRSIANRLAAEEKKDDEPKDDKETALSKKDPTLPVCSTQNNVLISNIILLTRVQ